MITISLTSFMKILTKGTPQKVQEYSRYLAPGGYDFYWKLKEASYLRTVGGKKFPECVLPIDGISRETERKHNRSGLESLDKWCLKNKVESFFSVPKHRVLTPAGFATIKMDPEFGIFFKGSNRIVQIWSSQTSGLNKAAVWAGLYLLEKHLCVDDFSHCKAGLLDLRKGDLLVADAIPSSMKIVIDSELAWIDNFFKEHSKAA